MTNLQNYVNWEATVDIDGGTLVSVNADRKAVKTTASTESVFGIAINNAKAGEVVAVKLAYPVATVACVAGSYTAGSVVYLGANGKVSATGTIACGWYVGETKTLTADDTIDVAVSHVHVEE